MLHSLQSSAPQPVWAISFFFFFWRTEHSGFTEMWMSITYQHQTTVGSCAEMIMLVACLSTIQYKLSVSVSLFCKMSIWMSMIYGQSRRCCSLACVRSRLDQRLIQRNPFPHGNLLLVYQSLMVIQKWIEAAVRGKNRGIPWILFVGDSWSPAMGERDWSEHANCVSSFAHTDDATGL